MLFLRGVSRKKEELRLTASIVTDKVKLSVTCEKWGGTMMANLKLKREINVGSVRVHGNCMEFGNTAVQLSNISSLSTSEVKTSLLGGGDYFTYWLCVVVCPLAAWWGFYFSGSFRAFCTTGK